jgi:glycerol-3-phosphate dehydrogenase (NAD(P)+)
MYTNSDPIGGKLAGPSKMWWQSERESAMAWDWAVTLAALITRGLAEITRLALAVEGRRVSSGLAGLGDLLLTRLALLAEIGQ